MSQEHVKKWIEITGQQPPKSTVEHDYFVRVLAAYDKGDLDTLVMNYHLAANNLDVVEAENKRLKDKLQAMLNTQHLQETISQDKAQFKFGRSMRKVTKFLWKATSSRGGGLTVVLFDTHDSNSKLAINGVVVQKGYEGNKHGYREHVYIPRRSGTVRVNIVDDNNNAYIFKTGQQTFRQDGYNAEGKWEEYGENTTIRLVDDNRTMIIEDASLRAQMKE